MRDYKKEYANYHGKPEQIKKRAGRVKARRLMIKKVGKAALQNKDVDHKDRNANNNAYSNLRIQTKKENRSRNK